MKKRDDRERSRSIYDLPLCIHMAIRLAAVKSRRSPSNVIEEMVRRDLPDDVATAEEEVKKLEDKG